MWLKTIFLINLNLSAALYSQSNSPSTSSGHSINFDHISIENGLSQNTIVCIFQDSKGFMWFGTQTGLNKYDGVNFTIYKQDPRDSTSLSGNYVWSIHEDSAGTLWIGTNDGLNKFDRATETFTHYRHDPDNPNSLSGNTLLSIYAAPTDSGRVLWLGTNEGLDKLDLSATNLSRSRSAAEKKSDSRLNRGQTATFTHYKHDPDNPNSLGGNMVLCIYAFPADKGRVFWLGTDKGLDKLMLPAPNLFRRGRDSSGKESNPRLNQAQTPTFTHYKHDPDNPNSVSGDNVWSLCADSEEVLWVGTFGSGLNKFDLESETFTHYLHDPSDPHSLSNNNILSIYKDRTGVLWIGTSGGGLNKLVLNEAEGLALQPNQPNRGTRAAFTHYKHDPGDPNSLSGTNVWSISEDNAGLLWIGTIDGGLNKFNRKKDKFRHYKHVHNNPNSLNDNSVWAICEDKPGTLWIGTWDGGLNRLDRKTATVTHYQHDPNNPNSLMRNRVRSIIADRQGALWIGTNAGLTKLVPTTTLRLRSGQGSGQALSPDATGKGLETETFTHYTHDPNNPNSLSDNNILFLYEDRAGALWIGTWDGGLNNLDPETKTFTHYKHDPNNSNSLSHNTVRVIYEDKAGVLWVGTIRGGLNRFDRETKTFTHYQNDPNNPNSLSYNSISSIYEDPAGALWIGTLGGGLNRLDRETGTFTFYTEKHGLPSNVVYGILADKHGNLWLSTNKGLSKFTPPNPPMVEREGMFRTYDIKDGLQSNEFHFGAYYKSKSGEMFFGGINGLNSFYPDQIEDNPFVPPIVITSFKIFNKEAGLDKHISETGAIDLSYKDYVFSFEFVALDYTFPEKNRYAYKMEGFDADWIYSGTRRHVTYTNLDPGDYTFRVKGSNNDGVWNEEGVFTKITIAPPFWATWWFYLLSVMTGIVGLYSFIAVRTRSLERQRRVLEETVTTRTKELKQEKGNVEHINLEIAKSFSLLEAAMESTADGMLIVNLDGKIVNFNRQFAEMWRIPQEILNTGDDDGALDFVLSQLSAPEAFLKKVRDLYATPLAESFDELNFKDGRVFERHSKPQLLQRKPVGRVWSFRDITERKRTETALRESEEKYRTILENIEDGYYEVDIAGNFTFFNDALCEILGYGKDELPGMNDRQYTDAKSAQKMFQAFNKVYTTGKPSKGANWEIIRKDGKRRFVEASVSLLTNAEGEVTGFRGIVRDITARKELEEQLLHAQRMESIGTLAGGVAHEFNNLLTVILGNAEFGLQDSKPDEPVYQEFVEIEKAAAHARDLTSRLLSFSRTMALKPKLLNLNKTLEEMLKILKRIIGENIDLQIKLAPELSPIWADPLQLQQVLMNLLTNARDAMPGGGQLVLETRNVASDKIQTLFPASDKSDNYVQLKISDTGRGMDKETQDRIFDPFFTTKEVGKGTGLGLAVVYGIVQQHKGNIEFTSKVGAGTTFKIYFPGVSETKTREQLTKKVQAAHGGTESILVAEDEEAVRNVAVRILRGLGYKVLTANDGMEAIRVFEEKKDQVDLVILDVMMPKLNGPEAYDRMRAINPNLPVIFATGYDVKAQMKNLEHEKQESITTLQKPYTRDILSKKVREILDQGYLRQFGR